ncbi:hypothetical protein ACQKFJ_29985, partial [Bacillus mycoides]
FAIIYPLPLSPLIISSIDTFIDVKTLNGTYIGSGKGLSLKRIIVELEKLTERKVDFTCYKQRQENVQKIILNIDRVRRECNWEPKIDFKSGIRLNKLWIEEFLYSKK